ncbi:putative succinyl-coA:3-ketoacid-coenzyme A transferase,mitochondrial precursor [Trypanosoma grayi]|uniref:putative succinyl-coA:3-ketoacid-coenzyme A transferase,mitochondrial precursor n=1 Tax=Trypanosoma grayi TaxID=71804 RepID=UPI0004F451B5|nr:putative succinyl-coA:3-ketoacid-coenzyme A transferase,mitochondrial precursor [Trypanosoma grayi]KEG06265.1 putative succinyl-coA:3-ketoacid-coenzyme A transferase,mitochondrial precursor [Trypanosoma grayi]
MLRRTFLRMAGLDKVMSMKMAVDDIKSGASLSVGGFGTAGMPHAIMQEIKNRGVRDLTIYSDGAGIDGYGIGVLFDDKQIRKMVVSYVGNNKIFAKQYLSGDVELEFCPQGSLAERMRAGGAGIPAFYTATGFGTLTQTGGQITKYNKDGSVANESQPKETRHIDGRWYVLERAIRTDFSVVKAWKADRSGNLVFRGTSRNFNVPAGQCGRTVIAEVENLVENGELDPNEVHLPGVYVNRVVVPEPYKTHIEKRTITRPNETAKPTEATSPEEQARQRIARRAALEFADGMYVNLGIGIPTESANYIPAGVSVVLQSENGLIGMGPFPTEDKVDADWINAGKQTISYLPGAALFDSATSFGMIRGGHMNITMLGALEVGANGDLANFMIPGKLVKGPGGAMDLVSSGTRVVVTTMHCNKKGVSKIVERCQLPVTGKNCVNRIITEHAVFDVENGQLVLKEVAEGMSVDQLAKMTSAHFQVGKVKTMPLAPLP